MAGGRGEEGKKRRRQEYHEVAEYVKGQNKLKKEEKKNGIWKKSMDPKGC